MNKKDDIKELKEKLRKKKTEEVPNGFLSTGVTLLNLACSGNPSGGLLKGCYYLFVGDSASGKSFLARTILAEAARNPEFNNHRFIYDDVENGVLMDTEKFFGKKLVSRLEPPSYREGEVFYSSTIEEFYYHVDDACNQEKPFIYILDSMDGLTTEDEETQFQAEKKAYEKDKDVGGSYGTAKAKKNSAFLRVVCNKIRKSGSILIIISQTRDNIGFGAKFNPKTRSGGKALRFYATLELWLSSKGSSDYEKQAKNVKEAYGMTAVCKIKKNRIQGKERDIEFPILYDYGIDDIGANVNFLVKRGQWSESKGVIDAKEFNLKCRKENLIEKIQEQGLEKDLRNLVSKVWQEIEEILKVSRKKRYE